MANKSSDQLDKLLAKMQDMPAKNWYYIFGAVMVTIFVIDYFLLVRPQLATLSKINPEIKILSDDLKQTKIDIERITQYRDQVKDLKGDVEELRLRVRTRNEVAYIIEKISRIAHKNDVKIDQIMPNPLQQEVIHENPEKIYYDLPIIIEARSGFHDFGRFINELEKDETFFKVDEFTLAAMTGSRLNAVKLTLKTIVYEDN